MLINARQERLMASVAQEGFLTVRELAGLLDVSEATVRRDLEHLEADGRVRRTHGGALAVRPVSDNAPRPIPVAAASPGALIEGVDVLVASPSDPALDRALLDRAAQRGVPVIAESAPLAGAATLVAADNFVAAAELGRWAGDYARDHFGGRAAVLDLTYDLPNTRARSAGFAAGIRERIPASVPVLSINAGPTRAMAHQITRDVLEVHPEINIIFAINDATAIGAIEAAKDHGAPEGDLLILPFGLEGQTLRDSLLSCGYCRAGLAMFPEIVGTVCIDAAMRAYDGRPLPEQVVTPTAVVTPETLNCYYTRGAAGWELNMQTVAQLQIPLEPWPASGPPAGRLPKRIGFVIPFAEHEWYLSLARQMAAYAAERGIELEVMDAEQTRQDEAAMREREIARVAAGCVAPGDAVLIDAGSVTVYLAEALAGRAGITVITNSTRVLEALRNRPGITLLATGGLLRPGSDALSGSTAELALRELRADKLFLTASGVTSGFGLSHHDPSEVATKQAMIRAAREVILLADHTRFGQESVAQVAPLSAVSRLITDSALEAGARLELGKAGIEVIIARG